MKKIIEAIRQAKRRMFPAHQWAYATISNIEYRTCTQCGCCHEMEVDGWGSYWVTVNDGASPSACAA